MRLSRAILISLLATVALTLVLSLVLGTMAFGLFLLLPLSFMFSNRRRRPRTEPHDPQSPVEPK